MLQQLQLYQLFEALVAGIAESQSDCRPRSSRGKLPLRQIGIQIWLRRYSQHDAGDVRGKVSIP